MLVRTAPTALNSIIMSDQPTPSGAKPEGAEKKLIAGLLGILLGSLAIHKFYLGYTKPAVIHLVISLVTCGAVGSIIGLIEGIIYLTMSDEEFVETYVKNEKAWF